MNSAICLWEVSLPSRVGAPHPHLPSPGGHGVSVWRLAGQTWRLVSAGAQKQMSLLDLTGGCQGTSPLGPEAIFICFFLHSPHLQRYGFIFTSELTGGG